MAAPRQNEMNDRATVVAITIFAEAGRFGDDSPEAEVDTRSAYHSNPPEIADV